MAKAATNLLLFLFADGLSGGGTKKCKFSVVAIANKHAAHARARVCKVFFFRPFTPMRAAVGRFVSARSPPFCSATRSENGRRSFLSVRFCRFSTRLTATRSRALNALARWLTARVLPHRSLFSPASIAVAAAAAIVVVVVVVDGRRRRRINCRLLKRLRTRLARSSSR